MSSTGMTTSISSGLLMPASTIADRPRHAGRRPPPEEPRHLLQRALGGRQPDALRRCGRDLLEPLEGQGEVGPALGRGEGVDLVDDDGLDAGQRLGGRARQHQVEALGRGDQQVRRVPDEALAVTRGRVAGAHRHLWLDHALADALGGEGDAGQWGAQVLLDVEREGPQGRDVQDAGAPSPILGRGARDERVDGRQEGGERLAAPRRRADQGVLARRDRRPPVDLRPGRLGERRGEPGPHCGREGLEHLVMSDESRLTRGCHSESGRR